MNWKKIGTRFIEIIEHGSKLALLAGLVMLIILNTLSSMMFYMTITEGGQDYILEDSKATTIIQGYENWVYIIGIAALVYSLTLALKLLLSKLDTEQNTVEDVESGSS